MISWNSSLSLAARPHIKPCLYLYDPRSSSRDILFVVKPADIMPVLDQLDAAWKNNQRPHASKRTDRRSVGSMVQWLVRILDLRLNPCWMLLVVGYATSWYKCTRILCTYA